MCYFYEYRRYSNPSDPPFPLEIFSRCFLDHNNNHLRQAFVVNVGLTGHHVGALYLGPGTLQVFDRGSVVCRKSHSLRSYFSEHTYRQVELSVGNLKGQLINIIMIINDSLCCPFQKSGTKILTQVFFFLVMLPRLSTGGGLAAGMPKRISTVNIHIN